jgi:hypothetical protein
MEIWLAVVLFVGYSLYAGFGGMQGGIAHFAHLGGAAVGFAVLKVLEWRRGSAKRDFQRQLRPETPSSGGFAARVSAARWTGMSLDGLYELNREEVVGLLDKMRDEGVASLTDAERDFLNRMVGR